MSLEILKERFSVNHLTKDDIIPELEKEIENKENTILNLEEKGNNLSSQIVTLEKENNNLLQELNNARHFEEGVFSIKEKDYINEIQSKENIIKEIKSEFNPLYKKIDEQKVRLSYTDDIIKKYTNTNKELNEKINKLNYKANYEQRNSKEIISEIKSERCFTSFDNESIFSFKFKICSFFSVNSSLTFLLILIFFFKLIIKLLASFNLSKDSFNLVLWLFIISFFDVNAFSYASKLFI